MNKRQRKKLARRPMSRHSFGIFAHIMLNASKRHRPQEIPVSQELKDLYSKIYGTGVIE